MFISSVILSVHLTNTNALQLGLGWAFLPDKLALRNSLILVGLSRCITMVLIWMRLAGGDNKYCAILVAVNSMLQMALFVPLAILFLRVISGTDTEVSYNIIAKSVAVFLGIPLGAAIVADFGLRKLIGPTWYDEVCLKFAAPWSLISLLFTILILLASRAASRAPNIVRCQGCSATDYLLWGHCLPYTLNNI